MVDENIMWASAAAIRMALILYAVWHDSNFAVKYTDVDYMVFSDAARFVAEGASPYLRPTYRYTPIIAYLLVPNTWIHPAWGKLIFAVADLACGRIIRRILQLQGQASESRIQVLVAMWVWNPIVINVSTRGNAEAIVSLLVLATLWAVLERRVVLGGFMLGLAIHTKIYPIVYSLPLYLSLEPENCSRVTHTDSYTLTRRSKHSRSKGSSQDDVASGSSNLRKWQLAAASWLRSFLSLERLVFTGMTVGTLIALTACFHFIYGFEFLQHAYLYHVTRADHRHNFSLYFYQLYLCVCGGESAAVDDGGSGAITAAPTHSSIALLAFLPQVLLLVALSTKLASRRHIATCICCQTVCFVALNKVYTVQYFVWYMALLPLTLARGELPSLRSFLAFALLILLSMASWLAHAYQLEFLGRPVWLSLVACSSLLLFSHVALFVALVRRTAMF